MANAVLVDQESISYAGTYSSGNDNIEKVQVGTDIC